MSFALSMIEMVCAREFADWILAFDIRISAPMNACKVDENELWKLWSYFYERSLLEKVKVLDKWIFKNVKLKKHCSHCSMVEINKKS